MLSKVLVIDDELELAETCVRLIEGMGLVCLKAIDGPQALALIEKERPDIVLTDLNLPHGDGMEILRYVGEVLPQTPVIVMTAYHTPDVAKAAKEAGVSAYLRKPFLAIELADAIRTSLDRRSSA